MRKAKRPPNPNEPLRDLPDRRRMERTMAEMRRLLESQNFSSIEEANAFLQKAMAAGQLEEMAPPQTPLEQAQDLMYDAFDAPSAARRIQLAHKALEVSPDCADAYVLLAEEAAQTPWESIRLYEQGMAAGERALGPERFEELAGDFWGMMETRPYMRARFGLARLLTILGRRMEAIEHYRAMLRLNPGDNQGARHLLCCALLDIGADDEAQELLDKYDDRTAVWLYSRALLLYRREGSRRAAEAALQAALRQNPHVPTFLLHEKAVPDKLPNYMGVGDETEAIAYAMENTVTWFRTLGALEWMDSLRRSARAQRRAHRH